MGILLLARSLTFFGFSDDDGFSSAGADTWVDDDAQSDWVDDDGTTDV